MRAIAALSYDTVDQVLHAGEAQHAQQATTGGDIGTLSQQQVQQAADVALGIAGLLRSTAKPDASLHSGSSSQTLAAAVSEAEPVVPGTASPPAAPVDHQHPERQDASIEQPLPTIQDAQLTQTTQSPNAAAPVARQQPIGASTAATDRQPTAEAASSSTAGIEAAALSERQQAASRAVDDLFAEVTAAPATAGATVLAAAAGDTPIAGLLRQQTADHAMQELFGGEQTSSRSHDGTNTGVSAPASADVPATTAAQSAVTTAATVRADAGSVPETAAQSAAALPSMHAAALQTTQAQEHTAAAQFDQAETQPELPAQSSTQTSESPDASSDGAAARQDALDQAIDELTFPEPTGSYSIPSSRSTDTSPHSDHSYQVEAEAPPPASCSGGSSDGESSSGTASAAEGLADDLEDIDRAALQAARLQVHESLDAALCALDLQDRSDFDSEQREPTSAAAQGASAALATAAGPAPSRAVGRRLGQGVMGLPSLKAVPRSTGTPGAAALADNNSPAATTTVTVASAEQPGDADMQQACRDMVQRMREAAQDDDEYHEGQNLLDFIPGIRADREATPDVIEEHLRRRDQMPKLLLDAEEDREGDSWKTEIPYFYAINSHYRNGHAVHVREQTICRRQIGFPDKSGRKRRLKRMVRRALTVTAAAIAAGFVTKRLYRRRDSDTGNGESDSGTDSEDDTEATGHVADPTAELPLEEEAADTALYSSESDDEHASTA